jgi:hypothetical protein
MIEDVVVVRAIRGVLERAAKGKGLHSHYVTSYQIIDRLPKGMRVGLIEKHGKAGRGAGSHASAAKHVAKLLDGMAGIDVEYFDTRGVAFRLGPEQVKAGFSVCGLYRLSRPAASAAG